MSFDSLELSRFLGRPIRLFVFMRQGLTWRYCAGDQNQTIDGNTYLAGQIDRGEIKQTFERTKDQIKIKLAYLRNPNAPEFPSTQPLGDNWYPYTPSDTVRVICMAAHIGDLDPPNVEWMGMVTQPEFTDAELTLTCEPGVAIARALNQGPKWQRACWKTVYSTGPRGCQLPLDAFAVPATLTGVAGVVLTAAEFASAPLTLAGGWFEWTRADGLIDRRSIVSHTGTSIVLLYGAEDLAPAVEGVARPHCEQTWAACDARSNTVNFGGAIYKPVKDPGKDSMSWG